MATAPAGVGARDGICDEAFREGPREIPGVTELERDICATLYESESVENSSLSTLDLEVRVACDEVLADLLSPPSLGRENERKNPGIGGGGGGGGGGAMVALRD